MVDDQVVHQHFAPADDEPVGSVEPARAAKGQVARALLAVNQVETDPALETLLRIGPPEEKVRALLAAAKDDDVRRAARAEEELEKFAEHWNREVGIPEAPGGGLAGWEEWYRKVVRFPAE